MSFDACVEGTLHEPAIECFLHLLQESTLVARNGANDIRGAELFTAFRTHRLRPLRRAYRSAIKKQYRIALIGLTNVGKSTLMQALLGSDVAPAANGPTTGIPTWYEHHEGWGLEFDSARGDLRTERKHCADAQAVSKELKQRTNSKGAIDLFKQIRVRGPMPILSNGLCLADTPGFGAAQEGATEHEHTRALAGFLGTEIDRVYFCISAGSDSWRVSEVELATFKAAAGVCNDIDIVINKWTGTIEDQDEYRAKYQSSFPGARFVFVNARRALKQSTVPAADREHPGVEPLLEMIERCATPRERLATCDRELIEAWHDLQRALKRQNLQAKWQVLPRDRFFQSCLCHEALRELCPSIKEEMARKWNP